MAETAVARETLFALRETIARLEGRPVPELAAAEQEVRAADDGRRRDADERLLLPLGIAHLDKALEGGLPLDGMTEIRSHLLRDAGAASGFALALASWLQWGRLQSGKDEKDSFPVLWIGDRVAAMEAGFPYAVGLKDFGLQPERFLHAAPRKLEEALWLAETAVASGVFSVIILEVRGNPARFGLTESRRLSLRAKTAGRPLFVLRQAGEEEASSATFRFSVEPGPASSRLLPDGSMLGGSIGNPVFRLTLEKSRNPAPLSILLEWNSHDRQFNAPVPEPERSLPAERKPAHSGAHLSASADRSDRAKALEPVLAVVRTP